MPSYTQSLTEKKLTSPPPWLAANIHYETITGSMSYGVSSDSSDLDLIGFCIPKKEAIFPHLSGHIEGFGEQPYRFNQYQQHHIMDKSARGGKGQEYDITIYNIVKYFQLVTNCNPNMIDSIFVPNTCITQMTQIGQMVRDNRKMFLHKGVWHKFRGYAYSQLHKMSTKNPIGKRKETIAKYGFDVKFGYHVVRLIQEVEMILNECDLDLQRGNEVLKAIRRGDRTAEWIVQFFEDKEKQLEQAYNDSKLPHKPDEEKIKELLLNCLEQHYGSLSSVINTPIVNENAAIQALKDIMAIINKQQI
jgi:uncharacterized protein